MAHTKPGARRSLFCILLLCLAVLPLSAYTITEPHWVEGKAQESVYPDLTDKPNGLAVRTLEEIDTFFANRIWLASVTNRHGARGSSGSGGSGGLGGSSDPGGSSGYRGSGGSGSSGGPRRSGSSGGSGSESSGGSRRSGDSGSSGDSDGGATTSPPPPPDPNVAGTDRRLRDFDTKVPNTTGAVGTAGRQSG